MEVCDSDRDTPPDDAATVDAGGLLKGDGGLGLRGGPFADRWGEGCFLGEDRVEGGREDTNPLSLSGGGRLGGGTADIH